MSYDTDTTALSNRIDTHARYADRDFEAWALEHCKLAPGQVVLDLGCGTGKQTLPIASAVSPDGRVVAVDASQDAIDTLNANADGRPIKTYTMSFDEMPTLRRLAADLRVGEEAVFDRVVSCFALYYARYPIPLVTAINDALDADNGLLFFAGPDEGNNEEFRRFTEMLGIEWSRRARVLSFMDTAADTAYQLFSDVKELGFDNAVTFDTADALVTYWKASSVYVPDLANEFQFAADVHFATYGRFETVKRVRAVVARK